MNMYKKVWEAHFQVNLCYKASVCQLRISGQCGALEYTAEFTGTLHLGLTVNLLVSMCFLILVVSINLVFFYFGYVIAYLRQILKTRKRTKKPGIYFLNIYSYFNAKHIHLKRTIKYIVGFGYIKN